MAMQPEFARRVALIVLLALLAVGGNTAAVAETLFESHRLTPPEYDGIEGPAVDPSSALYVVNFKRKGTIGRLLPGASRSELFASLPKGSTGNGIRFDRKGRMYVADYTGHMVFVLEPGTREPRPYARPGFNQPNDLAIAANGTLYASDPKRGRGRIWRITREPDGTGRATVMRSDRPMGRTNGLDLSPDGGTLFVGESNTFELWAYRIEGGRLVAPRRVRKFSADLDGLRTNVDGEIYAARVDSGTVDILKPDGRVVRRVRLTGKHPTNLTFGGPDGRTVFVTQAVIEL